jgi:hypothetical protein
MVSVFADLVRQVGVGETVSDGPVMRRKRNGLWEYRACTPEETEDYVSRESW